MRERHAGDGGRHFMFPRGVLLAVTAVLAVAGAGAVIADVPGQDRLGPPDAVGAPPPTTAPASPEIQSPAPTPPAAAPAPAATPTGTRLAAVVLRALDDPRLAGTTVGVSVWAEGLGEVAAHHSDLALNPASNQKLYTAMAALALLPPGDTFTTEVRSAGTLAGGVLEGDLVLVGGGDPTLRSTGAHSLAVLADAVADAGVSRVGGALVGDESRYDTERRAAGWFDWHVPDFVGPLSALTVDRNQHTAGASFAVDPIPANLELFRRALVRRGVTVEGPSAAGVAPARARILAARSSAPIADVVAGMLLRSDNQAAELLVKEIGFQVRGRGSTGEGLAAAHEALAGLGVHLVGTSADGSGLSRQNFRSAREWRALLQAARAQPWGDRLLASLPVGGRSGTLASRFRSTPAAGNVRAKTGWILEGRALSGYLTTAGRRQIVFSVVVNGTTPRSPAVGAIDDLVLALAREDD